MFRIGCHLSCSKGFLNMGRMAEQIGANTFQFFTRNPRGGSVKDINPTDVAAFLDFAKEHHIATILAHAPYTLNACAADVSIRKFALNTFADDLKRMEVVPYNAYNFHPGSHVGQGMEKGIDLIVDTLNTVMWPEMTTTVLLETMAGKGSEVGGKFEELAAIIARVKLTDKIGVCLDTCHVYDAGYDIVNDLDGILNEFDRVIGLNKLQAIHLNDSKNPFASHKDRHEQIGKGALGLEAMVRIINHPKLRHLPFYLETPHEEMSGYAGEIALLKGQYRG